MPELIEIQETDDVVYTSDRGRLRAWKVYARGDLVEVHPVTKAALNNEDDEDDDEGRVEELEAQLADARRAIDEIRPVVEYVDNDVTYDGAWGEILMGAIVRLEERLKAVRDLARNPTTINAAAGGGNLVSQIKVVFPENIDAALDPDEA